MRASLHEGKLISQVDSVSSQPDSPVRNLPGHALSHSETEILQLTLQQTCSSVLHQS